MTSFIVSPSEHIKKTEEGTSSKDGLREGCEVFEAVKAIGKMIALYYRSKED